MAHREFYEALRRLLSRLYCGPVAVAWTISATSFVEAFARPVPEPCEVLRRAGGRGPPFVGFPQRSRFAMSDAGHGVPGGDRAGCRKVQAALRDPGVAFVRE